jgi:CRISPR/Cas system-associated endonuclease/helicase Cas3
VDIVRRQAGHARLIMRMNTKLKKRYQNNRNKALQQLAHNTEEQFQRKDEECDWHEDFIIEALISMDDYLKTEG